MRPPPLASALSHLRQRLAQESRAFWREIVSPAAAAAVEERQRLQGGLPRALPPLQQALRAHAARLRALAARTERGPFHSGMTVHAAHARHAGAQAIFAAHGLPDCPSCPVGEDETLEEAAHAEGLPLAPLLDALQALLPPA